MPRKCSVCGYEMFRVTLLGTCLCLECFGCGAELFLTITTPEAMEVGKFLSSTNPGVPLTRLGDLIDA